ncbi:Potassium channel [Aspergillus wentii]|nr:Potassium channel [Aspergillus wentii]
MAFMVWLLVGAAIFQQAIGIPFSDALYFCDLTILTLGFGDITPQDSVARGLVLPYAVIGIIILGLAVGSIHRFGKQLRYENVVRKHIERKRQSTFERSTTYEPRSKEAELKRLGLPSRAMEEPIESTQQTSQISSKSRRRKRPIRSAIGALSRPKLLVMREEKDRFDAMRAIQRETIRFRRWTNLVFIIIIFGIFWSCGAIVFWKLENITYFEALYFGFCSLLTIGYGDIAPKTNAGRPFFFVWSLCAVPTMTVLISEMGDTIIAGFKHATNRVGEWTVLPQSEKHTSILSRFPRIFAFLKHREEKQRIAHGFPIGPDEEQATHPRQSLSDLARTPTPPATQIAQHLVFAIQRVTKDALDDKPKYYTYEEWVEFTRMIRFTDPARQDGLVVDEDEYGILNWDWIGETSPMVASQTEPEWVLERLCESLVRYLAVQEQSRDGGGGGGEEFTLRKERDIGIDGG